MDENVSRALGNAQPAADLRDITVLLAFMRNSKIAKARCTEQMPDSFMRELLPAGRRYGALDPGGDAVLDVRRKAARKIRESEGVAALVAALLPYA